jgi:hypothetical protein
MFGISVLAIIAALVALAIWADRGWISRRIRSPHSPAGASAPAMLGRRRGCEREARALGFERADDVLQVPDRTRQPVDAGDHQHVTVADEIEHSAQLGAALGAGAALLLGTDHVAAAVRRLPRGPRCQERAKVARDPDVGRQYEAFALRGAEMAVQAERARTVGRPRCPNLPQLVLFYRTDGHVGMC